MGEGHPRSNRTTYEHSFKTTQRRTPTAYTFPFQSRNIYSKKISSVSKVRCSISRSRSKEYRFSPGSMMGPT
jgi:hypothetical protein